MLANYDAKAIAEVMGLAFVRQPGLAPNAPTKTRSGRVEATSATEMVLRIGDETVLVIELKAGRYSTSSVRQKQSGRQNTATALDRVTSPSPSFIERAVSGGLPRNALRHVAETLAGADEAKISALEWDVVPKTTLDRRKSRLSVGESERTERIARLFVHARRALGTEAEAREFMGTPHPELDGRSPLQVAATDLGTRRAEQILNALEYGLAL